MGASISKIESCRAVGERCFWQISLISLLARALAEIASQITDADTAQRLMALVHQLMTDASVRLAVTIAEATKSDSEATPDVINETWAERGFGWRMVRLS